MRRHRRGGKAVRGQRRKTLTHRKATKTGRRRSFAAGKETNVARLTRERDEALERQIATSEVLKVISSSPGELEPVFKAMLENATRICEAKFGTMWLREGDAFRAVALHNAPSAYEERRRRNRLLRPVDLHPKSPFRRFLETRQVIHIADLRVDPGYLAGAPTTIDIVDLAGARTGLLVPMLKGNELVGGIIIYRQEVRPFTEKQIDLVQNFAAQAVIAIENTRLLNELRQRTRDLSEALEQQTATSEVLNVISGSPSELEPVFNAMLANATRICEAKFGNLYLRDEDGIRLAASHNGPPGLMSVRRGRRIKPGSDTALGEVIRTKHTAHVTDLAATRAYIERHPDTVEAVDVGGVRTVLAVPLLKDDEFVGLISIYRQEVRPFTDKQIELLTNFATQAVIAIENARLLNDLNKLNQQLEQRVADQVSEIERMGRLRRFLPPQVADLIVASGTEKQLESHRREISALFCDLRGFTGFSESSDPEDVMALLREYHAAIGEIINKYGGTLERYAGDGVMVVFNDPIPVDNPALQAVRMAIDMRVAIGELIEKWRKLGHDIGFGIGIAHGFATLGTIGFEGRFDYAAIGTVSNVASRLCDEAKPGQILISPRVLMAVEKDIAVEPVGDFSLKGIRRPLTAYNVLHTKAAD
jgi:class 3 adenylate cyclase/putative methionine-R-sulfoxide reductase with GAF domain